MIRCPNCNFEITRNKKDFRRSNPQNRYFHGCVLPILSEHTGYDENEMKAVIKWQFGIRHSSDLNTKEFETWMGMVRKWVASPDSEFNKKFGTDGLFIPEPNQLVNI